MGMAVYQGAPGAYSQLALDHGLTQRGVRADMRGLESYRAVAACVASGRAEYGIFPLENVVAGTVREAYNLLAEFDLKPFLEVLWHTDHRLLGIPNATLKDVKEILAHPLVIAECGRFLNSLQSARAVPCEDTGIAAREVSRMGNKEVAALGPRVAGALYGLSELAANIADTPNTYSRFCLFMSANTSALNDRCDRSVPRKTSLMLNLAHRPGVLSKCLSDLAAAKVNLTKVESRPYLENAHEHEYIVDFVGDSREEPIAAALENITSYADTVRLLGSYDAHSGPPICESSAELESLTRPKWVEYDQSPPAVPITESGTPRVARMAKPNGTTVRIGAHRIGDGEFVVIAGPCSVESREQIMATARAVKHAGAMMLRGGAFKPRTSPYAFQGLGWEGVPLLAEAGRATGMPTVSEVMSMDHVKRMADQVDVLQIGARNMQNFELLKCVGRTGHPVLLKRGLSATIDELLAAAEYILAEGNPNVILCERGIRTYETATRNTLDLSAVPVLRERSHLPVMVDPSHGVGVRRWVAPLCLAAKAVGAHGLLIEVHPNPQEAKSDPDQALTFEDFSQIMLRLEAIPAQTFSGRPA